jgi:hypothetical protein
VATFVKYILVVGYFGHDKEDDTKIGLFSHPLSFSIHKFFNTLL